MRWVAGITGTGTVTSSGRGTALVAILCIESLSLWLAVATVPGITGTGTYIPVQVTDPEWNKEGRGNRRNTIFIDNKKEQIFGKISVPSANKSLGGIEGVGRVGNSLSPVVGSNINYFKPQCCWGGGGGGEGCHLAEHFFHSHFTINLMKLLG